MEDININKNSCLRGFFCVLPQMHATMRGFSRDWADLIKI
ncbi:hypothetical protein D554_1557 [Bordetella holmesii 30539]|uniref:N-acetyltransferase YedL n=1 Tax=Bordetella holmesii 1058 TaxID=1247648 RepID=A0ABP3BNP0_9BORD|nr:hypothetical protein D560_2105 [Bordetella holmesii ATCC 51541]AIT26747.1 hypothetical protein D558_2080 [Bordetella holmesii 44057]EWM43656.1 hypothetical protein D556_2096 [Bordetella holmesii 41130]EWM47338.1 hypothetical protein D555_2124 [Bordetella holmesii 35009]EWM51495.1 hypothetical protein D557_1351 [Bordetella holmesii 70147]EXF88743.1 hypothetical protein D554_1557 [Bordetella holmesii 30539]EXX96566.1 hypothetical protein D559_0195 [Bordetella holmesii 1058]